MRSKAVLLVLAIFVLVPSTFSASIHTNQVGFYPQEQKLAVVVGAVNDSFFVVNKKNRVIFTGLLNKDKYWDASDEHIRIADFSALKDTGTYIIQCKGCPDSYPFRISSRVLSDVAKGSLKSFYYNRASIDLDKKYAGKWARKAGHPDTAAIIHPAAASGAVMAGSYYSSPEGWYDAGDFGKYIVNSGISVYTLLTAYQAFPDYYKNLKLDIPESSNNIPDILDEVLWNLRWMLTMQDQNDGGVYHKLTTARFCGEILPENDKEIRYILPKSITATFDFAAVMALASRVLKPYEKELPGLADRCLKASLAAWGWGRKNPTAFYKQKEMNEKYDPDVVTGEYGEWMGMGKDELQWAATELYISTKQDSFFTIAYPDSQIRVSLPGWQNVGTLGLYSLLLSKDTLTSAVNRDSILNILLSTAQSYVKVCDSSAYHITMQKGDFYWGSNSVAANQGMLLVIAYLLTGDDMYKKTAFDQIDYLLGRNPVGYCFVTGYGTKSSRLPHHRASIADGIFEPVPGFLVGGPNPGLQDTAHCKCYKSTLPALSYADTSCSYASNEVAINWSAPMAFLTGAAEALTGWKNSKY